jgi:alanine dehydrogenase
MPDPSLPLAVDRLVVDDWEQCCRDGQPQPLIEQGVLTRDHLHAEIGELVCGRKRGRSHPDERILFWHRGFAVGDIMVGSFIYEAARRQNRGQWLTLWEAGGEE